MIWVMFAFAFVLTLKYYTSTQMRSLERRLNAVKDQLHKAKGKLAEKDAQQDAAAAQEAIQVERIRAMKEIIQDLQIRLTMGDQPGDTESLPSAHTF